MKAVPKTNAARQLDKAMITYEMRTYDCDGQNFDGCLVADQVGLAYASVYKTLVVMSPSGDIVVCLIPVDRKLDLKALAVASGHKRLEMLPLDRINSVTGYLRGGCSPVGMKKLYPTFIDEAARSLEQISVSAGVRGMQMLLCPEDLIRITGATIGSFAMS